ncbi:Linear gramicidin dehydrogenase LgrE [Blautia producta]|uniref:Linear gramicidin dehydrogenase LgrE n=1 Tax=Blautia producta TaxID=33035 RepID=A0A4V0Z709_9FIRM|nr:alpha/beta fold hydrolase [Blautia producta]QBE95158.1 Linear gramicidin dehydrogenase LgrE [Blautia producta]
MQKLETLVKGIDKVRQEDKILLCFPFAGGGASAFYGWNERLPDRVRSCPIQLPGREERIMEKPYVDMENLIDDVVSALYCVKQELLIFGHSMGAKIAYEVSKRLEKEGKRVEVLMVSGSRAPHIPEPNPIYHLSDEEFKKELGRFEGTPKEILDNQELLDFFLPMLRADFTMDEIYQSKDQAKLHCPIIALGGEADQEADWREIETWGAYTDAGFEYKIFPGGHFFIKTRESEVLSFIRKIIMEYVHA